MDDRDDLQMPGPDKPRLPGGYPALADEIAASEFGNRDLAAEFGVHESTFSRYLNGERTAPEDFENRVRITLASLRRDLEVARAAIRAERARRAAIRAERARPSGDAA